MKFFKTFAAFVIIAISINLISCSESSTSSDDDNPDITPGSVSFVLDGGEFNNQKFEFNVGAGIYGAEENQTVLTFTRTDQSSNVIITFPGNKTGTFEIGDNCGVVFNLEGTGIIGLLSGTVKVTSYGGVGSYINGTFSGTSTSPTNPSITVKDGKFSALRSY